MKIEMLAFVNAAFMLDFYYSRTSQEVNQDKIRVGDGAPPSTQFHQLGSEGPAFAEASRSHNTRPLIRNLNILIF